MQKRTLVMTLAICGAVIAAGTWLAYAGDLNPPVGPIEPTMVTLDEIYDAAAGGSTECPECVWESVWMPGGGSTAWGVVVPGSGVLHAIIVSGASSSTRFELADGGDPESGGVRVVTAYPMLGSSASGDFSTACYPLDIRFENDLYARLVSATSEYKHGGMVLFRSDP